jgi:tetratricopeptide (TPR) repeat protein
VSDAASAGATQTPIEAVMDRVRAGDLVTARRLSIAALEGGQEHPLLLNLRALDHEEHGRLEESLADLRRAHVLAPRDFATLNACGLALGRMERFAEAISCFVQTLKLEPRFAQAWFNHGWALERLGDTALARTSYEKAVELMPEHAEAWACLAWLASRRGDGAEAKTAATKALALQPDHPTASMVLGSPGVSPPAEAERLMKRLLATPDLAELRRGMALGQLGDALDALDRPAEAFAAYAEGNSVFQAEAQPRFEAPGQETAASSVAWLNRWAEELDATRWRSGERAAPGRARESGHVFLLGFPRSGTTLIETLLAGHPDVVSLEERNTLEGAVRAFLGEARGLAALGAADERELSFYRDDYWRRVKSFDVDPAGKLFIDKNPFNTLRLPLIYKLFPSAKVIFAVRDPRDVVLSCFRRRFSLNPSTYLLLDLARAATFYAGNMRFAEALRPKQDLPEHRLVYERLVADFEAEARAVLEFIGLSWRPELADIGARARRGEIASASSAQIARGLYTDGSGQWRRYADQLALVMPTLAPWVRKFGYSET